MSQLSMVPSASSPAGGSDTLSISQRIFVALKYGSITNPVRARTNGECPASMSSAQMCAVRVSCHTIARCATSPVRKFHASVVSRWFVMPTAATGRPPVDPSPSNSTSSASVSHVASQISFASCSTHPGSPRCCANRRYENATSLPRSSTAIDRTPVVPASIATTTALSADAASSRTRLKLRWNTCEC